MAITAVFVLILGVAVGFVLASIVTPTYDARVPTDNGIGGPVGDVEAGKIQGGNVFVFVSVDQYVTGIESNSSSMPMVLYTDDFGKPETSTILLPIDGPGTYSVTVESENQTRKFRVRVTRSWTLDFGNIAGEIV